jgi:pyruvate-formate lyase
MVKKMSNKEKIQQKAEEAAAGIKEKTEKKVKKVKKEKKTTPSKKAAKATGRQKIVWKVFNDSFKEVDCFPYQEKDKAYLRAAELTRTKNKNYFVNEVCVPMVEE